MGEGGRKCEKVMKGYETREKRVELRGLDGSESIRKVEEVEEG